MNYDKSPSIKLKNMSGHVFTGYEKICEEINRKINGMKKAVIAVDCYHGVYDKEILPALQKGLSPVKVIDTRNIMKDEKYIEDMLERNITDDRVFGTMCLYNLDFFIDGEKAEKARKEVECTENGVVLVYGVGASLVSEYSLLVYADMARWEIQMRFRKNKVANFCASNFEEDPTRKYKRAFFVDWRVIDRHKKKLYEKIDYLLDTNIEGNPKMITGDAFREGMKKAVSQPFRVVPYFDPGVWGGQWMKKVCGLDPNQKNFAWCFDCVPEENSLFLEIDGIKVEMPSINLVFYRPIELLGDRVHARFGTEFPIRFDFLDTIDGGNLSLQVHPLTEYIQETFGMHYTQDESYYLLDALEDASV